METAICNGQKENDVGVKRKNKKHILVKKEYNKMKKLGDQLWSRQL